MSDAPRWRSGTFGLTDSDVRPSSSARNGSSDEARESAYAFREVMGDRRRAERGETEETHEDETPSPRSTFL